MAFVIDKLKGGMIHEHAIRNVTSDPATAKDGATILNTADSTIKVFYDGTWYTLHTLSIPDNILLEGLDFVLLESGDKVLKEG